MTAANNLAPNVGQLERRTQNRIIALFRDELGYEYLGNWEEREKNSNVEEEYLRAFLTCFGHKAVLIDRAVTELKKVAGNQTKSLYDINKEVYGLLRYGVKVREGVGENHQTIALIDWNNPQRNHFAVAEEVTVHGKRTASSTCASCSVPRR